jgi:hypothetical protein
MLLHAEPPQHRKRRPNIPSSFSEGRGRISKLAIAKYDGQKKTRLHPQKITYSIVHINETNEPYF